MYFFFCSALGIYVRRILTRKEEDKEDKEDKEEEDKKLK